MTIKIGKYLALLLLAGGSLFFPACEEDPADEMEDAVEEAGDSVEEATD